MSINEFNDDTAVNGSEVGRVMRVSRSTEHNRIREGYRIRPICRQTTVLRDFSESPGDYGMTEAETNLDRLFRKVDRLRIHAWGVSSRTRRKNNNYFTTAFS